ncbi:MAG: phosphopantetheine-binding protein [Thiogranum sp.]|nr:phosphopantetheine-binding protein [Thiogranum sp.]
MCIKIGDDERETVRALMTMTLNAVVADLFGCDLNAISPDLNLRTDLNLDAAKQCKLQQRVQEYFGGVRFDFAHIETLDDLYRQVVAVES